MTTSGAPQPRRLVRERGGPPLWAQLEADLQRRVAEGDFGAVFPGEHELAEQYGVSRYTVREALRRLRASGLVDSARGRTSSVRPLPFEQPIGTLYSLFRSVEATGVEQLSRVRVLDTRVDLRVAEALGAPEDTPFVHVERLRLADGEPLALDRNWLLHSLAEPLLRARFGHAALYDELNRLTGIRLTGGRETIAAAIADARTRRLLGITAKTAVLNIVRVGCLDGRPIELRESLIRGDRFTMVAEWPGEAGYRVGVPGLTR